MENKTYKRPYKQADILWNRVGIESEKEYPVRVIVDATDNYIGKLFLFKNRELADSFCYGLKSGRDIKDWNYKIIDFNFSKPLRHTVKNGKLLKGKG